MKYMEPVVVRAAPKKWIFIAAIKPQPAVLKQAAKAGFDGDFCLQKQVGHPPPFR
jgi:hypothetical protein